MTKELIDSVLSEEVKQEALDVPDYSDKELIYISNLQKRLETVKLARSQQFEEFDNLSLSQYFKANEVAGNTMLKAKKNRVDTVYQSGTLRTKMLAFLSSFQGLNLRPDISAYRQDNVPVNVIGNAMEDVIYKTEELEGDEEKRMLRQYELLKQGTVFLEEMWEEKWEVEKEITQGFEGEIKKAKWKTKKTLSEGKPTRKILSMPSVYLGDLKQYDIEEQSYIFTVKVENRTKLEQIYGKWDRWQYVSKAKKSFSGDEAMQNNAWRLTDDLGEDEVEVIKYQDKPNQEFQIILNGVLMLPMGYPFPWKHGEYSIVQQNLEPIRHDFAYGKSFIFKNKNLVAILDEMMKLAVLKTQKSFVPPYLNLSGRIISKTVFMPGHISRGIGQGELVPVSDKEAQGVTNSEFAMVQEIIRSIDSNTSSQTFSGAKERGGQTTATQIIELQRQAKVMMGILILAVTLLEKKLTTKRLMILIENWFNPIDTVMDDARKTLKNKYRIVSVMRTIDGEGQGVRMTIPTDNSFSSEDIMQKENELKEKIGMPIRIMALNPKEIQLFKLLWNVTITPKEKETSEVNKLMFSAMISEAVNLGLKLNPSYIEQRFAEVWGETAEKMFDKEEQQQAGGVMPTSENAPKIKTPRVEVGKSKTVGTQV